VAKKPKYVIETSAVKAALGYSSSPHEAHFKSATADGELFGSAYIRKETIRRFVCEIIEFASLVEMSTSISDAESWWGEKYGRAPKLLSFIAGALRRKGIELQDHETHKGAVEYAQIALEMVQLFDADLGRMIPNSCGCKIGNKKLTVDGNQLMLSMNRFRHEFLQDVAACPINGFLQLGNPKGRTAKLLGNPETSRTQKIRDVCLPLKNLHVTTPVPTVSCGECGGIGDPVIAMEQPRAYTLVHVDHSYNKLCVALDRKHKPIRSNASFMPRTPTTAAIALATTPVSSPPPAPPATT
jgi:hypothetical protein